MVCNSLVQLIITIPFQRLQHMQVPKTLCDKNPGSGYTRCIAVDILLRRYSSFLLTCTHIQRTKYGSQIKLIKFLKSTTFIILSKNSAKLMFSSTRRISRGLDFYILHVLHYFNITSLSLSIEMKQLGKISF